MCEMSEAINFVRQCGTGYPSSWESVNCASSWSTRVLGGFITDQIPTRNFGIPKFNVLLALVACVQEFKVNTAQVSRKQTETDDPSQDRKAVWMHTGIHEPHVNTKCE